jgi:hypothetical protein
VSIVTLSADSVIASIWTQGLDWEFKKNWAEANRNQYESLHDQEATPGQPFPYCVIEVGKVKVDARMTGHDKNEKHQIVSVPVEFRVHARGMSGSGKTAKAIAGELADAVLAYFGGHPTTAPKAATLSQGTLLLVQYQSHFGTRTGDEEYQITINYLVQLDQQYQT